VWADNGGFRPNPGQFPIQVERHLNAYVASHLPGVTTVTAGARYYSLHGYVAQVAADEGLDEPATVQLLRRCEVLLAYVTQRHGSSPDHDRRTPPGHRIDAIVRLSGGGSVDLAKCAAASAYAQPKWGFSAAYRGSELTLKILDQSGYVPGEWHDPAATNAALGALVERARGRDELTGPEADELHAACLCRMATDDDGAWFAKLLSGQPGSLGEKPTLGALLWQLGRLVTVAITDHAVLTAGELSEVLMYDHELANDRRLAGRVAPARWRGALLRAESVWAWRRIWQRINQLVSGAKPIPELADAFADALPDTTVRAFRDALPPVADSQGRPLPAERQLDHMDELNRWLGIVILGAVRAEHLSSEERIGFANRSENHKGQWEELTPGCTEALLSSYDSRSLRDLAREMADSGEPLPTSRAAQGDLRPHDIAVQIPGPAARARRHRHQRIRRDRPRPGNPAPAVPVDRTTDRAVQHRNRRSTATRTQR
jgi:hypothetical protein